ncbi:EamA-like transporter family protein [compost metagenome]
MLFQSSIRLVGASNTVSYLPLIPIFGVLMSVGFLHDRPTSLQLAGLGVAIAGVIVANRPARVAQSASS